MASSSDEGEIIEGGHIGDSKATSLPQHLGRNGVDRQDRPRSRQSTPDHDSASRYSNSSRRSRSPRGFKRSHDDRDNYPRRWDREPARRDRPTYNEPYRDDYRRPRISYEDLDRPASRGSTNNYDPRDRDQGRHRDRSREPRRPRDHDRERHSDKRPRHRSRSPGRLNQSATPSTGRFVKEGHGGRKLNSSARLPYDGHDDRQTGPRSSHGHVGNSSNSSKNDAKSGRGAKKLDGRPQDSPLTQDTESYDDYEEPEPIDEEAEIERRRKRREEILAKSSSATPLLLHAVGATDKARAMSPASAEPSTPRTPQSDVMSPSSPGSNSAPSPGSMNVLNDTELMNSHVKAQNGDEDGPSAANYDPTVDMREDERRDELRHGHVLLHGEPHILETTEKEAAPAPEVAMAESKQDDDDDDDFDMFADDFDEDKFTAKSTKSAQPLESSDAAPDAQANDKGGILEGDDKDGYYKFRVGEILHGRYQIQATLGRGMFSGVARALDLNTKQLVAIKIMRNNDALRKGGYTEIAILEKLNEADPENRRHIVKFERSFDYRGHLCMAFENLSMNLREVLRKFGNNVGINLTATRAYAYQIFVALAHMRKCHIVHADLKPDNILVSENRSVLKICDLGTAIDKSDAAMAQTGVTPYLVSRFYRAPEIIMGIPYDYGVDMWSIGCTLYELYTGKILFAGDSNNQMLKAIMEIRGKITPKLFKRGQLSATHFDEMGQFYSVERDKVLGKTSVRTLSMVKPTRDLRTRLMAASDGMSGTESRELHQFVDLLDHCLALNPDKRIKPADALRHPFFAFKSSSAKK